MATPTLNFETLQSSDCKSFGFRETTGTGVTGWNGSNSPLISAIVYASLTIPLSNGTTVVLSDAQGFFPPVFPNTAGTIFTVTSELLGLGTSVNISDWLPYITYSVSVNADGSSPISVSKYKFISCNSNCCKNRLMAAADLDSCCDDCSSKSLDTYIEAQVLYDSITNGLECSTPLPNDANKDLQALTDLCNSSGCGGCGCH